MIVGPRCEAYVTPLKGKVRRCGMRPHSLVEGRTLCYRHGYHARKVAAYAAERRAEKGTSTA
jgi:hypothetical protein